MLQCRNSNEIAEFEPEKGTLNLYISLHVNEIGACDCVSGLANIKPFKYKVIQIIYLYILLKIQF